MFFKNTLQPSFTERLVLPVFATTTASFIQAFTPEEQVLSRDCSGVKRGFEKNIQMLPKYVSPCSRAEKDHSDCPEDDIQVKNKRKVFDVI